MSVVFNAIPKLATIGTQEQYSKYLDTIFPDSQYKDIVYHGTASPEKIEKFRAQKDRIYFSDDVTAARYASWDDFNRSQYDPESPTKLQVIPAVIRLTNPVLLDNVNFRETETNKEGDGIIGTNIADPLGGTENQIVVRTPEQTHILGTQEDIEGFRNFVSQSTAQPSTDTPVTGRITDTNAPDGLPGIPRSSSDCQ